MAPPKIHRGKPKSLQCLFCSNIYCNSTSLEYHTNLHTGEHPYACQDCEETFTDSTNLRQHRALVHLGQRYKTVRKQVTPKINRKSTLSKPITVPRNKKASSRISSNQLTHQCLFCFKDYQGYNALEVHMNQHSGEKPYECTQCTAVFSDHRYLGLHMDKVHNGKVYVCQGCHQEYYSQGTLSRHRNGGYCTGVKKIHHSVKSKDKNVKINVVNKKPRNVTGKVEKSQANHKVTDESKTMSSKLNFTSEKSTGKIDKVKKAVKSSGQENVKLKRKIGGKIGIIRNSAKDLPCLPKTEDIIDRKPIVTKSAVYKCTRCPTTHLDRNLLLRHAADCHGRKIFKCTICPNLYTEYCNMTRHLKISHGNESMQKRDTKCGQCNLKFATYSQLWMHKKKKHDLKLFKCPYCPNEYTQHSNMIRHRKVHGVVSAGVIKEVIRLPKVYETETVNKKKKQVDVKVSTEIKEEREKLEKFPVLVDVNKIGMSDNCSQQLLEIINQVRIQREQNIEKNVSFFLHLNRYDPSTV